MSTRWLTTAAAHLAALRCALRQAPAVARRLIGAPDYDAYLRGAHGRAGGAPLTREEFQAERLHARYSRPGSRCC